jgi:hypothetical protein
MVLITSVSGSMVAQQVRSVPIFVFDHADGFGVQVADAEPRGGKRCDVSAGAVGPLFPHTRIVSPLRTARHSQNSGIDWGG